jgi:hypothetical protein
LTFSSPSLIFAINDLASVVNGRALYASGCS